MPGQVPGFRDLGPDEAEALRATQEAVLAEMRRWGYRFVVTPSVESLDVLDLGLEPEQRRRLFKFSDGDGRLLALVGEKTVPVARLVASKLRHTPLPLRLCYAAPVLANDPTRFDHRRETYQVGAELIGASGAAADAEVIALALRCLEEAGLSRFQIDVGHTEFFQGLTGRLPAEVRVAVKSALQARDFVALEAVLGKVALRSAEQELLLRFPTLRGGPEILEAAGKLVRNRRSQRALEELQEVSELLTAAHGLGAEVQLDLGAIRDFDYYTGIIFEGYGPELGRPLAQGGRYDGLLARFGRAAPATGFVLQLELACEVLRLTGRSPALPRLEAAVAWSAGGQKAALRLGASLRMFGMRTVVDTQPRAIGGARAWAAALAARNLVFCPGGDEVAWSEGRGRPRRLPPEQVVARLAATLA